ncbi:MAG TPA: hypothetical protein VNN19_11490 [bacterium]|nr:hypothetical protein [bacterium]
MIYRIGRTWRSALGRTTLRGALRTAGLLLAAGSLLIALLTASTISSPPDGAAPARDDGVHEELPLPPARERLDRI